MRPDDERYNTLKLVGKGNSTVHFSYLIAAWPVLDPYGRYLFAKENNRNFLIAATNSYFLQNETMIEGNPLLALERGERLDLPPVLIIQGTANTNLPLDSINRFARAYRAAGGDIELEWFADMPHGFA
jgi:acetyl esterase